MFHIQDCMMVVDDNLSFSVRVSMDEDGEFEGYYIGTVYHGKDKYSNRTLPDHLRKIVIHKMENVTPEELFASIS